ncbi:hypothetical protein N7454_006147 [Penicillium verhagenii]|nr:hypothetical protein N7454_006147 [Penicillium verhagenii]
MDTPLVFFGSDPISTSGLLARAYYGTINQGFQNSTFEDAYENPSWRISQIWCRSGLLLTSQRLDILVDQPSLTSKKHRLISTTTIRKNSMAQVE